MCEYSATAANSRDARQSEDLVLTQAPHGGSSWLTEAGKPGIAVCIPNTAVLAVQLPKAEVRGATFEEIREGDANGNHDFLNFINGARERIALNSLPKQTKVRILHLQAAHLGAMAPVIPATIGSAETDSDELVSVGMPGSRRNRRTRLFDLD
jgi:hypothetical protein